MQAWVAADLLAAALLMGGCGEDRKGESTGVDGPQPLTSDPRAPSTCERPSVRVHVDVMSCKLLQDKKVAQRLKEEVAPRLVKLFDTAPVTNACDGTCGIDLELNVETVDWCEDEVSGRKFHEGELGTAKHVAHVARLRKQDPSVRLMLWGVDYVAEDGKQPSGDADDRDAIIAMGGVYRSKKLGLQDYAGPEAAILMHELGHTLGLTHGHPQCSLRDLQSGHCARLPHHLSVMNYGWLARGVGYGGRGTQLEAWSPTYQGFVTLPFDEIQGAVVKLDSESPGCPAGNLPKPAQQPWVAFYPNGPHHSPRRVPIANRLSVEHIADHTSVNSNGECRPPPVSAATRPIANGTRVDFNGDCQPGERYTGLPNEWEWIVTKTALDLEGLGTDPDVAHDLEELSIDALVEDLESSIAKSEPGVPK